MNIPYFSCVLARDLNSGGIGYQGKLPWKIEEDLREFYKITSVKDSVVIMGKRTWESLPYALPHRINVVLGRDFNSLNDALQQYKDKNIFVIGGKKLFQEAFKHEKLESIYITNIHFRNSPLFDVYFEEEIPSNFELVNRRKVVHDEYTLSFEKWNKKIESDEYNYLNLLKNVLLNGEKGRGNRTITPTISLFGPQIEFDLSKGFPLLTTKKVNLRVIFEELMWMLRGQTNSKILKNKGIGIWDGNSSSDFLKKLNLPYEEGEMGPIYGAQWRNFGGIHDLKEERHIEKDGVDQIGDVIHLLKTDPTSRRILVSAWNPCVLDKVALPPCHMLFQFYTRNEFLNCKLTMRSNDLFLGAPFNIASYSLLTFMLAKMCNFTPGKLIYSLGDAHIYENHIEQVKTQLLRPVRSFPKLEILNVKEKIEDYEFEDFKLSDYDPHPFIKGEMAV